VRALLPKEKNSAAVKNLIGFQGRMGHIDHRPYPIIEPVPLFSIAAFAIRRMISFRWSPFRQFI